MRLVEDGSIIHQVEVQSSAARCGISLRCIILYCCVLLYLLYAPVPVVCALLGLAAGDRALSYGAALQLRYMT
jgi:hypothetical protein